MAFAVNSGRKNFSDKFRPQGLNSRSSTDAKTRFNTYFCENRKVRGHTIQRCYKIHGYPPHFKTDRKVAANVFVDDTTIGSNEISQEQRSEINKIEGFTEAQYNQLLQLLNRNKNEETQSNIKAAHVTGKICLASSSNGNWIIDSGATDHICYDLTLFSNIKSVPGNSSHIIIPNGKQVLVSKMGDIKVNDNISLNDVLFVPDFKFNLISIPKLCKDLCYTVMFTDNSCFIQTPSMKQMLLGKFRSGLYYMEEESNSADSYSEHNVEGELFVAASQKDSTDQAIIMLWHLRMGHFSVSMLHHLKDLFDKPYKLDNNCQVCPSAKQTRMSFSHSKIRNTKSF